MSFRTALAVRNLLFTSSAAKFCSHQMPGFAIFFEAHELGFTMRIKTQHRRGHANAYWQHIPEVERDNVGDEEVDVLGAVNGATFANSVSGAGFVSAGAKAISSFDLNAEKMATVVEDKVVALGVSPGLGDTEAEFASFVEKCGFGALSTAFSVF